MPKSIEIALTVLLIAAATWLVSAAVVNAAEASHIFAALQK